VKYVINEQSIMNAYERLKKLVLFICIIVLPRVKSNENVTRKADGSFLDFLLSQATTLPASSGSSSWGDLLFPQGAQPLIDLLT
jgi:hypothetical protein